MGGVLALHRRATELAADDEAAWWNLGIAATALGDWPTARAAWKGFGINLPEGEGPIEIDYGLVPIRLRPAEVGEVVWGRRIDPARAIVDSVPLPESDRRWRDLVLHDGAPNGYRKLGDQEVPVFDELELLAASPFTTFVAEVACAGPRAAAALVERLDEVEDTRAEDWTASVRTLCRACSEGRPHEHHDHEAADAGGWQPHRRLGIAAREAGNERTVEFGRLAPGTWRVTGWAKTKQGTFLLEQQDVGLTAGRTSLELELQGKVYRGRVSRHGQPLAAVVDLRPVVHDARAAVQFRTENDGEFSIPLAAPGTCSSGLTVGMRSS